MHVPPAGLDHFGRWNFSGFDVLAQGCSGYPQFLSSLIGRVSQHSEVYINDIVLECQRHFYRRLSSMAPGSMKRLLLWANLEKVFFELFANGRPTGNDQSTLHRYSRLFQRVLRHDKLPRSRLIARTDLRILNHVGNPWLVQMEQRLAWLF